MQYKTAVEIRIAYDKAETNPSELERLRMQYIKAASREYKLKHGKRCPQPGFLSWRLLYPVELLERLDNEKTEINLRTYV